MPRIDQCAVGGPSSPGALRKTSDGGQMESLEDEFQEAVKFIKRCERELDRNVRSQLYGLHSQSTLGDCNRPKPFFLNFRGRRKWTEWVLLKGTESHAAKLRYVRMVNELKSATERDVTR